MYACMYVRYDSNNRRSHEFKKGLLGWDIGRVVKGKEGVEIIKYNVSMSEILKN